MSPSVTCHSHPTHQLPGGFAGPPHRVTALGCSSSAWSHWGFTGIVQPARFAHSSQGCSRHRWGPGCDSGCCGMSGAPGWSVEEAGASSPCLAVSFSSFSSFSFPFFLLPPFFFLLILLQDPFLPLFLPLYRVPQPNRLRFGQVASGMVFGELACPGAT